MTQHSIHSLDIVEQSKLEQDFSAHSLELYKQLQSNIGHSIHQEYSLWWRKHGQQFQTW